MATLEAAYGGGDRLLGESTAARCRKASATVCGERPLTKPQQVWQRHVRASRRDVRAVVALLFGSGSGARWLVSRDATEIVIGAVRVAHSTATFGWMMTRR
jgi:hypothetical protein